MPFSIMAISFCILTSNAQEIQVLHILTNTSYVLFSC